MLESLCNIAKKLFFFVLLSLIPRCQVPADTVQTYFFKLYLIKEQRAFDIVCNIFLLDGNILVHFFHKIEMITNILSNLVYLVDKIAIIRSFRMFFDHLQHNSLSILHIFHQILLLNGQLKEPRRHFRSVLCTINNT